MGDTTDDEEHTMLHYGTNNDDCNDFYVENQDFMTMWALLGAMVHKDYMHQLNNPPAERTQTPWINIAISDGDDSYIRMYVAGTNID